MKRFEVGSWAMKTGSLNETRGNARVNLYFGGGSGEPTSRDVVNGTRLSIPKAGPVSECAGRSMTVIARKAAVTKIHNKLRGAVIVSYSRTAEATPSSSEMQAN